MRIWTQMHNLRTDTFLGLPWIYVYEQMDTNIIGGDWLPGHTVRFISEFIEQQLKEEVDSG